MALTQTQVSQLYVTLMGRASEGAGNAYWQTAAPNMVEGALLMLATKAVKDYFGASLNSNQAFIEHIYLNTLGKTYAQDKAGIDFWTAALNKGASRGKVTVDLINAVYQYEKSTDAAAKAAYDRFVNMVAVSNYTADKIQAPDLNPADPAAMNVFKGYISGVTNDPKTLEAAKAKIYNDANAVTLTNGTDKLFANVFNAGQVYTPGGDDRINSLQDEDVLTGTGTNPTLNATLGNANDNGATIITPTLSGVESLNIAFSGSGVNAVTGLDLQDSTGQKAVHITRVSQAVNQAEVGNLTVPAAELSLANTNANQRGTVEFSYATNVLAGENTGKLSIDNVQLGTLNVGENTSGIAALGVSLRGFEHLTLNSKGNNIINTINLPMDTGTNGDIKIEGSGDLRLGGRGNVVNNANNALIEATNVYAAGTGIAQPGGRISAIDGSKFDGNLTLVIDNILDVGKAGTSGVAQNVTVTGGKGDDTFVVFDAIQAGDKIIGGEGKDTIIFGAGSSIASAAEGIENASIQLNAFPAGAATSIDFDFLPDSTELNLRNISNNPVLGVNAVGGVARFTLYDLKAAQAAGITVQHSTTGNGSIGQTVIEAAVKANTGNDTLGVKIAEGTNVDPRFNFSIDTAVANTGTSTTAANSTFENVTLDDADSESNSVELQNFAQHTGKITLKGGVAGTFLNLDVDTAAADVDPTVAGVQQGLLGINTDGATADAVRGNAYDVANLATQVRLGAATIDASAEKADVIVRVSTNPNSVTGAQTILMGSGNDTVIFDHLSDSRAGLTISDKVSGGEGNDTLVIDGHGVRVSLGASEWTNVSGFETIRLVGNNAPALSTLIGQNSYNLVLTNDLIAANGKGMLNIVNDNDVANDQTNGANTPGTGVESAVTIDARSLNAQNHFTYNGEEGASRTTDKFIFSDANINGGNVIDGGAADNNPLTWGANADVMDVRNTATVTVGDLAGIKNVGIIAGTNDQATTQTLNLELNDTVVDALVDSYHGSTTTEVETLTVRMNNAADIPGAVAGAALNLDATALTGRSNVNITLDALAAQDTITLGVGTVRVTNFNIAPTQDKVALSVARFGLTLDADDIGLAATTNVGANGTNIRFGAPAAAAATDRIIFDTVTVAGQTSVYYDSDGNGAQAQILIGVIDKTLTPVNTVIVA